MTERKKLSLTKPDQAAPDTSGGTYRKPPVRGAGTAPRKRMTAAEAAQAREEMARRADESPAPRHPEARRQDTRPAPPRQDRRDEPRRDTRDTRPAGTDRSHRPPRDERPRADMATSPTQGPGLAQRKDHRRADGRADTRAPRDIPATPPREDDGRLRLSKLMSEQGLASRREADEWIEQGWVRVDGEVVSELGTRVFPHQVVTIDPLARTQQAQRVTILLHKPIGYVSGQAEDGYEPAVTLIKPENRWSDDKLPVQLTRGHLKNLAPAGRLDIDSTGLLVLTQDGRVAKQLIGEDSGIEKEYLVRVVYMPEPEAENVSAVVPPDAIEQLRFGLELDGRQLKPAQVSWQNEQQLRFVLREGRKRQIRRMCEQVGLKVVGLKRVRMGRIALGKLPQGQWRFLRPDERF